MAVLDDPDQTDWQCPGCGFFNSLPSLGECEECSWELLPEDDPHGLIWARNDRET